MHDAIVRGFNQLAEQYQVTVVQDLEQLLTAGSGGKADTEQYTLDAQVATAKQEFDSLLERMLASEEESDFLEARLKLAGDKLKALQQKQAKQRWQSTTATAPAMMISPQDLQISEYSETLVRRTIARITVADAEKIQIRFIDNSEITMAL